MHDLTQFVGVLLTHDTIRLLQSSHHTLCVAYMLAQVLLSLHDSPPLLSSSCLCAAGSKARSEQSSVAGSGPARKQSIHVASLHISGDV